MKRIVLTALLFAALFTQAARASGFGLVFIAEGAQQGAPESMIPSCFMQVEPFLLWYGQDWSRGGDHNIGLGAQFRLTDRVALYAAGQVRILFPDRAPASEGGAKLGVGYVITRQPTVEMLALASYWNEWLTGDGPTVKPAVGIRLFFPAVSE